MFAEMEEMFWDPPLDAELDRDAGEGTGDDPIPRGDDLGDELAPASPGDEFGRLANDCFGARAIPPVRVV